MLRRAVASFSLALVLGLAISGLAEERLVAIVNARNSVRSLDDSDMRNLFLGRTKFWDDNVPVEAFARPETTPAGRAFLVQLLQMTPSRFRHHWAGLQLSGQGTAPRVVDSVRSLFAQIASSRGGIGYATEAEARGADSRLKVVPIR